MFCAVLAWSRVRFVRFATDETRRDDVGDAGRVLRGARRGPEGGARRPDGLPEGRRGRQRGGARPRTTSGSPPITGSGPTSARATTRSRRASWRHLVGYAKRDLMIPLELEPFTEPDGPAGQRRSRRVVCRGQRRESIPRSARCPPSGCATERRPAGRAAVAAAAEIGPTPVTRKVDKLSCIRFALGPLLGAEPADRHHGAPCWSTGATGCRP